MRPAGRGLWGRGRSRDSEDRRLEAAAAAQARRTQPRAPAAMQDGNFLLSALQPEAGVCSLALPSDLQLDRRGTQGPEAERLRAARVQEQVRARLLQLGQQQRHNGTAEPGTVAGAARGASWGQYHTVQTGFSSRSQGLSGDSTSVSDTAPAGRV